jgi:hypothetical protein
MAHELLKGASAVDFTSLDRQARRGRRGRNDPVGVTANLGWGSASREAGTMDKTNGKSAHADSAQRQRGSGEAQG